MRKGDIVYRIIPHDKQARMEPVEVINILTVEVVEDGKKREDTRVTLRTSSGEICDEWEYMLTNVPFIPGIEEALGAREKDPKEG
jgi:hypothetical protein